MAHGSMAHGSFSHSTAAGTRAEARELLLKADHPRPIDRYIDFFGGLGAPHADVADDGCGEVALERPA